MSGWVALDSGRAVALLGATLEIVTEDHIGYTYTPPRYTSTPLSAWTATSWEDATAHLPTLVRAVAGDTREHGIARLLLQTRPHDWVAGALWRRLRMRPDAVLAGLTLTDASPTRTPRHRVRTATPTDEEALPRLAFEEYVFHAEHTGTGTLGTQPEEPTRREIGRAFAEQAAGTGETFLADGSDGQPVGSLRGMILELPDQSPSPATSCTDPHGRTPGRECTRRTRLSRTPGRGRRLRTRVG